MTENMKQKEEEMVEHERMLQRKWRREDEVNSFNRLNTVSVILTPPFCPPTTLYLQPSHPTSHSLPLLLSPGTRTFPTPYILFYFISLY